jgi:hypothetical protein
MRRITLPHAKVKDMSTNAVSRGIVAATFDTSDGAGKAAAAVMSANPGTIANAAVFAVRPDGTLKFFERKDWGAEGGALVGGAIGLLGGPRLRRHLRVAHDRRRS